MFKSLRFRLLFTYMMSFIIIVSVLSATTYYYQRKTLHNLIHTNSENLAEQYANVISGIISSHIAQLNTLANSDDAKGLNHDKIFSRYNEFVENDSLLFFTGGLLHPDGTMYDMAGSTRDVRDRQYFHDVFNNKSPYVISDAILGKFRGIQVIVIAVPIIVDGEVIAALVTPLRLNEISSSLNDVKLTDNSFGWIIDNKGLLIAHPNEDRILKQNILDGDKNGFIGLSKIGEEMTIKESGYGIYFDENQNIEKHLSYVPIHGTPGWRLGISTPTNDIFQPLDSQILTLGIIISIALFLSFLLAIVFSKNITNPIVDLTKAVDQMRSGTLEIIPTGKSKDEISKLISTFNAMASDLSDLSNNLKEKVGQRTKNLQDMNVYLNELATKDHLTKLYNRVYIINYLEELKVTIDKGTKDSFAIIFIDLNNFKYYNDTFGHDVGDVILFSCSEMLRQRFEDEVVIARYGGDEFLIVIDNISREHLGGLINSIRNSSLDISIINDNINKIIGTSDVQTDKNLSFAVGSSYYTSNNIISIDELIQIADKDMYKDKTSKKSLYKDLD